MGAKLQKKYVYDSLGASRRRGVDNGKSVPIAHGAGSGGAEIIASHAGVELTGCFVVQLVVLAPKQLEGDCGWDERANVHETRGMCAQAEKAQEGQMQS